jgi:flavin reductase (DIM6/NTAB) family NADH-FMN oxidoreductase RutF/DNA-binding MarR family transcriptional regulator
MTIKTGDADFNSHAFRRALGNFATGVTIITARNADGELVGATASSFNSLSMDPPLILWSCIKASRGCPIFETSTHFAVNVLASDQAELSNHFARQQEDKFSAIEWGEGIGGAPIFADCAARFQCESYQKIDGGDHWIFVGKVVAFDDFGRPPLCFHQGSYSTLFNHLAAEPASKERGDCQPADGRLEDHKFFQMLRAIRAYQDAYQPKVSALEVNLIESRLLLVVQDLPGLGAEGLTRHLNVPVHETEEALQNMQGRGFLAAQGDGFVLTELGRAKADAAWKLSHAHAQEAFADFSEDQLKSFSAVLRGLIEQGSPHKSLR